MKKEANNNATGGEKWLFVGLAVVLIIGIGGAILKNFQQSIEKRND